MYKAIVCKVNNSTDITGAKTIKRAMASGYQVIVNKDVPDGTLGIFFPPDGELSHEMCMANNLYRKHPDTGEAMGGFFESNRRVRTQKFLKVKSEGIYLPLTSISWTGTDISTLKENDQFSSFNDKLICQKYFSNAARQHLAKLPKEAKKRTNYSLMFKTHFETEQLRYNFNTIPNGSLVVITEKTHGTSGRTGYVKFEKEETRLTRFTNKILSWFNTKLDSGTWKYISGSRRVDLDENTLQEGGFYSGKQFRHLIHKQIETIGLHKGETLYYEIVGYDEQGGLIMPTHPIKDDELKKLYNKDEMTYSYGCKPGEYKVFIYRITMTNEDGYSLELPWSKVIERAQQLNMSTVPLLIEPFIYDGNKEELLDVCRTLSDGPDVLDSSHTREGICLRVESSTVNSIYKWKGWVFANLEGIRSNDEFFIDPEDVA